MRPRISITGSVHPSVRRSVRHATSKTREINIFEQKIVREGTLGPLDASLHLYKTVYRSIGLSVHRSVCLYQFHQVRARVGQD